jgi:hypothetical protein
MFQLHRATLQTVPRRRRVDMRHVGGDNVVVTQIIWTGVECVYFVALFVA